MADGTHPEVSNNDDLFGESTTAVAEPEQETGEEIPSGEVAVEESAEPEVAETEETTEPAEAQSEADPELDKFLAKKNIDRNKFDDYAERYQITPAMLKANPSLRYLVLDKLNADEALKGKEQSKVEEPKKQDPPAAVNAADHVKQTLEAVSKYNSPEVLKAFAARFNEETTPEGQFAVLSAAANNLIETVVPQLVESRLEQILDKVVPGFVGNYKSYQRGQEALQVWSEMREQNPNLPESFVEIEKAALAKMPSLGRVDLPLKERLEAYIALGAGQKVDPVTVEKAATKIAEKKLEQKQTAEKGKGLGAGQTKGTMAERKTGNDDIFGPVGETMSQRWTGRKQ
jgi:hypothetical protein